MPEMIVRVVGDTAGFQRSLRKASTDARGFTVNVQALSRAQVDASVKATARLREQAAAFRTIAATAKRGSAEQVEALRLAEKAERGFVTETRHAAAAHRDLRREIEGGIRGTLSASGAFERLGRTLAFASGGFVLTAGIGSFLRDSVGAARDATKAQASLAAQMRASNESFAENKTRVEAAALSYGKFGFENDEVIKSLTVLERGTGNINQALKLQAGVTDLARAKNLDLAAAANIVAKVFGGQETALRRAVPGLHENAHGLDLIREAFAKLHGQAAANTNEADRFAAILHDTKEIIGTALLPTLDRYLESLGKWLDRMNRTGQLQRDVNRAVHDTTDAFKAAKATIAPLAEAFRDFGKVVGGTKNELELLAGAFVAFKGAKLLTGLTTVEAAVAAIGTTAGKSSTKVGELGTKLGLLARLNPLAVIASLGALDVFAGRKAFTQQAAAGDKRVSSGFEQGSQLDQIFRAGLTGRHGTIAFRNGGSVNTSRLGGQEEVAFLRGVEQGLLNLFASVGRNASNGPARLAVPGAASGFVNGALTVSQQLALRPNDVNLLRQQAEHDRRAIAFAGRLRAENRISNEKWADEVRGYQDDLTQTLSTINSITSAAAKKAFDSIKRLQIPDFVQGQTNIFKSNLPRRTVLPGSNPGLVTPGNIDINHRKVAHNADGSISTVRTISIQTDQGEVLIPTVVNGRVVSNQQAIDHFMKTRQQLGVFSSVAAANAYSVRLHNQQARTFGRAPGGASSLFRSIFPLKIPAASGSAQVLRPGFAVPAELQVKLLEAQAFGHTGQIAGILKQERTLALKAFHSTRSSLDAQRDALQAIIDINDQLGQQTGSGTEVIKHISARAFARLPQFAGFNRAQRVAAEAAFAQSAAHSFTGPATHLSVLGQPSTVTVIVNGAGDPEAVARKVAEKVISANRARGSTTRGAFAGRGHLDS